METIEPIVRFLSKLGCFSMFRGRYPEREHPSMREGGKGLRVIVYKIPKYIPEQFCPSGEVFITPSVMDGILMEGLMPTDVLLNQQKTAEPLDDAWGNRLSRFVLPRTKVLLHIVTKGIDQSTTILLPREASAFALASGEATTTVKA